MYTCPPTALEHAKNSELITAPCRLLLLGHFATHFWKGIVENVGESFDALERYLRIVALSKRGQ